MRDVEILIKEFCTQNLPTEPAWSSILNRRFPKIAARMDIVKAMRCEIADHLRNSHEAYLAKGHNAEDAWRLAKEHFGDIVPISKEIYKARALSCKCLTIRLIAVGILFILSFARAEIRFTTFFHPQALCIIALCAAVGLLITRKRNMASIRKYALYGTWLGLLYGIIQANTVGPTEFGELGAAIAMILMSTFYGFLLAAPSARGWVLPAMAAVCQLGMLGRMSLGHSTGHFLLIPSRIDPALLSIGIGATLFSLLVGLTVFDIRRLHQHLSAVALLGMVSAWISILSRLRSSLSILDFALATSIPVLLSFMIASPIRTLQAYLLQESD